MAQICHKGILIGEISCPAKYEKDSSSINFIRSSIYGLGVLRVSLMYVLQSFKLYNFKLFKNLKWLNYLKINHLTSVISSWSIKFNYSINGLYNCVFSFSIFVLEIVFIIPFLSSILSERKNILCFKPHQFNIVFDVYFTSIYYTFLEYRQYK